ncbi:hypothetical protein CLOP_g3035 [Closterium sp. NIES-67]|nr:hypothetical protein CLOP_g3035 [Closterium sp. NIES-67]
MAARTILPSCIREFLVSSEQHPVLIWHRNIQHYSLRLIQLQIRYPESKTPVVVTVLALMEESPGPRASMARGFLGRYDRQEKPFWSLATLSRATSNITMQDGWRTSYQDSPSMAAGDAGFSDVPDLGGRKRKPASGSRKRKRSRGDTLPSESEVKAAAACDDDELSAAQLSAARVLARPSPAFSGALQAIINQARLRQTVGSLTSPLALAPSLESLTTSPVASQRSGHSMQSFTSLPLMAQDSSHGDLLTQGLFPNYTTLVTRGQSSNSTNLLTWGQSSNSTNLLTRGLPVESPRLDMASLNLSSPPILVSPPNNVDPALSWFPPAEELQRFQAAVREPSVPFMYECKECGRTFNLPQSLGGHMSRHKREKRLKMMRKRKAEADAQEVAESLCELQKASTSPESLNTAECAADAPSRKERRSTILDMVSAGNPLQGDGRQQPSLQALIDSQQQLLLYQQLLHLRLTMLPDGVLVPPASPLADPLQQQTQQPDRKKAQMVVVLPSASLVDPITQQLETGGHSGTVQEYGMCEVSAPGGILGSVGVKREENHPLEWMGGESWNASKGVSTIEKHRSGCGDSMRYGSSSGGSREVVMDLNSLPSEGLEP